jgi:uncharacterized protein involved in outer membrane biogenesis
MFLCSIIKQAVETGGPRFTQTTLKLGRASLSLLSGSGALQGIVLGNPAGYQTAFAIKVAQTELGVQPGSLLSDKIHITHLHVLGPEINFEGGLTENNLSQILDNVKSATGASKEPAQSSGATKKLLVDEFTVTGGKIYVTTALTGGQPLTVDLPDIRFTNLGQGADGLTAADLAERLLSELYQRALNAVQKRMG